MEESADDVDVVGGCRGVLAWYSEQRGGERSVSARVWKRRCVLRCVVHWPLVVVGVCEALRCRGRALLLLCCVLSWAAMRHR